MKLLSLGTVSITTKRNLSSKIPLPPCDFVPRKYQGPSFEQLKTLRQNFLNPALTTYYSTPLALHQGYKQWLYDINEKRYLDMFGGICTVSVGHSHPKITEVVTKQISTLGHVSNVYYHPKIHEYAERLTQKLPGNLKVVYFVNSGSEANDLAILLARAHTNNFEIISLRNGYHGMSCQTMSLTANSLYRYPVPQSAGFYHAMNPDVYRGIWGGKYCRDSPVQTLRNCSCSTNECEAKTKYLEQLAEIYQYSIPRKRAAAFFAESIQGVGGAVQYPKGYIQGAYNMVKEFGGLFVSDEVQTGFGRTGDHFWGFEMHGIIPDIVTMAKGIGNGFPLGAVVTTPEIAKSLTKAAHFNTFGGNPVSSAVGIAVLDIIEEEQLQENSKIVGTYLLEKLEKLRDQFSIVGDVRGKGLMVGVELVRGDGSTTPLSPEKVMKFWENCRDLGLIIGKGGYFGNVLRIKPPMCVTKADVDFTISVMKKALEEI
ncbi:hypothetical protein ILUMI_01479 [Ignelater luminosus]|uniref:Alanine--glyoxylate aminotransferase 2, mitochondrial n=1 Tax=Ignelater luminosus TaxID=2038154 RepID=A0A8K0DJM6_IGNLU|nr:hypothetical protein ILUMI_01479 [Ignelater luminosus]